MKNSGSSQIPAQSNSVSKASRNTAYFDSCFWEMPSLGQSRSLENPSGFVTKLAATSTSHFVISEIEQGHKSVQRSCEPCLYILSIWWALPVDVAHSLLKSETTRAIKEKLKWLTIDLTLKNDDRHPYRYEGHHKDQVGVSENVIHYFVLAPWCRYS